MMTDRRMRRSGATIRYGAGRWLVFAGVAAAGWSALTFVSGRFALPVGPLALSFRDPLRPLIAAASVAYRDAVFLVVPVFAAVAVWLTFLLGRRLDDGVTGASASLLLATSPIFLYQSVQPMSDVPAAALWLAALTATARSDQRGQILGGGCAALAVLMRPNLAPIVVPFAVLSFHLKAENT